MMKRSTLRDVAKHANVSMATVSIVINNLTGGNIAISEETRQRVLASVEELGYFPNLAARSLRTRRTQLLAVMVHDLTDSFFPYFVRGAQLAAETAGYQILVYDCVYDKDREVKFINSILQRRVDGVITVVYNAKPEAFEPILRNHIPIVAVGPQWDNFDSVGVADRKVEREVVAYLTSQGHRRIVHLAGSLAHPTGNSRFNGYCDGLADAEIAFDPKLICYGNYCRKGIEEQLAPIFKNKNKSDHPTAIASANYVMAIEAIKVLKRWGYCIPGDVAVVGFDNIPESEYVIPSLTTVDNCPEILGQKSVEIILKRLTSTETIEPQRVLLPAKLIIRQSA